ncbi:MAG: TRASH domain-containing protein [Deltaproteobacteria bacterium]|nr:TRASH domain-containing protein [Deltaproteobacteria bacterium]
MSAVTCTKTTGSQCRFPAIGIVYYICCSSCGTEFRETVSVKISYCRCSTKS